MRDNGRDPGVLHVPPGGGRAVWFNGGLVTFYALGEDTGGAFTLFEEAVAPEEGAPPHLHHEEDQAFFVLQGDHEFVCDGRAFEAKAGFFVYVPRGTVHSFENVGAEAGRLLILSAPAGGTEKFFLDRGEPAADRSSPPPDSRAPETLEDIAREKKIAQQYGSDLDLFALLRQISAKSPSERDESR